MPDLSLRGLDAHILTRIKAAALRRKISVNRIIIDTLGRQFGSPAQTYDDLDALAGKWSWQQAARFDTAVASFGEVDAALWVAKPKGVAEPKGVAKPKGVAEPKGVAKPKGVAEPKAAYRTITPRPVNVKRRPARK